MNSELQHVDAPSAERGPEDAEGNGRKDWITAPNGKIIKPTRYIKGKPVYTYDDLLELGPPYSNEPSWK